MAATTEAEITISASGGDAAAGQISAATGAINTLSQANQGLKGQFQERFQHIGLMLFAGDALRAAGLGHEARMVINTLNLALTEGAAAAGISSGGIMLVVVALTALAGIAAKVIAHHKDQTDALIKLGEASQKAAVSTQDEIKVLEQYRDALGKLPPALQNLLAADEKLYQQQIKSTLQTNQQTIAALNQRIATNKEMVSDEEATVTKLQAAMEHLIQNGLKPGMEGYTLLERTTLQYNEAQKKASSDSVKLASDQAQLNRTISDQIQLLHGNAESLDKVAKAAEDAVNRRVKAEEEGHHKNEEIMHKQVENAHKAFEEITKAHKKMEREHEKDIEAWTKNFETARDAMATSFGDAMAQMIIEGKNFTDTLVQGFKNLAEQFISDVSAMIVKWLALKAVMAIGFGFAGGGDFIAGQFGQDVMTGGPTLFLAGESGPEHVQITPLSGGGNSSASAGSGGGGVNIGSINVSVGVQGITDPRAIADQVGLEIVKAIRGRAQISMVGPSIL